MQAIDVEKTPKRRAWYNRAGSLATCWSAVGSTVPSDRQPLSSTKKNFSALSAVVRPMLFQQLGANYFTSLGTDKIKKNMMLHNWSITHSLQR